MLERHTPNGLTQVELRIALPEVFREVNYGAVSIIDQLYAMAACYPRSISAESDNRRAFLPFVVRD